MSKRFRRVTTTLMILGAAAMLHAGQAGEDTVAQRFTQRVDQYAMLRGAIESQIPLRLSSEGGEIEAEVHDLATAIRAARTRAHAGDIFDAEAAPMVRRRIEAALRAHNYDVDDLLEDISNEAPRFYPELTVNGRFDWRFGAMMPPVIIGVLPQLPEGVQYRFVGRDLVLVDIDAGLIVDVLRQALPVR